MAGWMDDTAQTNIERPMNESMHEAVIRERKPERKNECRNDSQLNEYIRQSVIPRPSLPSRHVPKLTDLDR